MSKLRLTFACGPYDRTLALRDGTIQPEDKHGLTDRRVKLEELFAPSTLRDIPLSEGQHV